MLLSTNHNPIRLSTALMRGPVMLYLLALLGFIWLQTPSLAAQDLQSMPWTDQDSGEPIPLGLQEQFQDRQPALTRDRSSIPKAPKRNATAWNWNWRWLSGGFGLIAYGLLFLGIALLLALIIWVFLNSRVEIGSGSNNDDFSRPDRSLAESIRHLPFEMDVTQGDFRQQAQTAYQAGDFRKALIFLFSHVLVTLDQEKLVRLKKGKTNRQYLRELSPSPPLVGYYGDVMIPFEQTFFGDYPITKDVFEQCWQGLNEFQDSVKTARANAVTKQGQGTHG